MLNRASLLTMALIRGLLIPRRLCSHPDLEDEGTFASRCVVLWWSIPIWV